MLSSARSDLGARLLQGSSSYPAEAFAARGNTHVNVVEGFQVADQEFMQFICRLRTLLCVFEPSSLG